VVSFAGVKTRHALLALLFIGLMALEVAHGLFRIRALEERERRNLVESVRRGQVELAAELKRRLEEEREHAAYLARLPSVRALLDAPGDEGALRRLEADILPYVLSFRGIDRVSAVDKSGRHRFRCERIGKGVGSIPPSSIEQEPDFGLVSLAKDAAPGSVVVSGMAHDSRRVEVPENDRQVLHFLAPVDTPKGRLGFLALTAYAAPILQGVRSYAPGTGIVTCLVDAEGAYLAHPDRTRERGRPAAGSLGVDAPGLAEKVLAGASQAVPEPGGAVLVAHPAGGPGPPWHIVTRVSREALQGASAGVSAEYYWVVASVVLITTLLAFAGFFLVRMSVRDVELREQARYRKQEEEMRRRVALSERLGSLGMLTAGVAHEINNPLEGIENYLVLLEREQASSEKRKRYIDMVRHGFHRIRDIVRDLSAFSRPGVESGTLDLGLAVRQALKMVGYTKELKQVAVELAGMDSPVLVPGDARRLEQVFINLLLNAAKAMGGKGQIWITARASSAAGGGEEVEVVVEDSGPGIPPDVLPRIFDPFFTTSDGTGLGLSICFGILQAHGGSIRAENRAEGGARFFLRLPAAEPAAQRIPLKERSEA